MDDGLISVAEAARRLGLDSRTVSAAIAMGDLKAVRFGRSLRVPAREIERLTSGIEG